MRGTPPGESLANPETTAMEAAIPTLLAQEDFASGTREPQVFESARPRVKIR